MTYSEVAARNAETIADVVQYEGDEVVILTRGEFDALKTAALVFQAEHAGCQMEIRDDIVR